MPPRKPRTPATTPTSTPTTTKPSEPVAIQTGLPTKINLKVPDFSSLIPADPFKPSSSVVPRTSDAEYEQELQTAKEQSNSLDLLNANMQNLGKLATAAVSASKAAKTIAEYYVSLEEIKTVGVKLRAAMALTANEEKNVTILEEKGNQLSVRLDGERIKTQVESAKNDLSQIDLLGYQQLQPIKQLEWQNKIQAAEIKAREALNGK
jgi:hypothetical protein